MPTTFNTDVSDINPLYLRYWVYSKEQYDVVKELNRKMGKSTTAPIVFIAGKRKPYTQMLKDPTKSRYSDYKVVAVGDIRTMKYTEWDF